jgi:hypothetical protein
MTGDERDCVLFEECAEAEETVKHQTYKTTWYNQMAAFQQIKLMVSLLTI